MKKSNTTFYVLFGCILLLSLIYYFSGSLVSCKFDKYDGALDELEEKLGLLEFQAGVSNVNSSFKVVLPVLVIAYNRPSVSICIQSIIEAREFFYSTRNDVEIIIYVNQDGYDERTTSAIKSFGSEVILINHSLSFVPKNVRRDFIGYYRLSRHFKDAINSIIYMDKRYESLIIIEDDLEVSKDIFSYFYNTLDILKKDKSLFCVSAWNDNGKDSLIDVKDTTKIYRSDFFAGLGWMLTRDLWEELKPIWPEAFWDEFMRDPKVRLNRTCLRPEVSRTSTFGEVGTSGGQFFNQHLKYIHANKNPVNFSSVDLSYLIGEASYKDHFMREINSPKTKIINDPDQISTPGNYRINYNDPKVFVSIAKKLGVMDDFKRGVPRTAYLGIVSIFYKGSRIFICPNPDTWKGYIDQ